MKKLIELVSLITINVSKPIDHINVKTTYNSLAQQFFKDLKEQKYTSDEEAAYALYENLSAVESKKYKNLKLKLEHLLLNSIFFINKSISDQYLHAYQNCHKEWAAIKIVMGRGGRQTGIQLAEELFKDTLKNGFTQLTIEIARHLRRHYSLYYGDMKKHLYLEKIIKQQKKILNAEILAESYFEELHLDILKINKKNSQTIRSKAKAYRIKLKKQLKKIDAPQISVSTYLVAVASYELEKDYKNVLKECNEALAHFKAQGFILSDEVHFTFSYKKLYYYILSRQFDKGISSIQETLALISKGAPNWYFILELQFILCLHTEHYHKAYEIIRKVLFYKNYHEIDPLIKKTWKIYEAYINYLVYIGEIGKTVFDTNKRLKKFNIEAFIDDMPPYDEQLRGLHIAKLIIQILLKVAIEKLPSIDPQLKALQAYLSKYLRNNASYRSNCFLKMLVILKESKFNKSMTIRKTASYLKKFQSKTTEIVHLSTDFEVIPYEVLWNSLLDTLDHK